MSLDLDRIPRWAPGPQARVNWSHPMTANLIFAWTAMGGDVAGKFTRTDVPSPGTPAVTPWGPAIAPSGSGSFGRWSYAGGRGDGAVTLIVVAHIGAGNAGGTLINMQTQSTAIAERWGTSIGIAGGNNTFSAGATPVTQLLRNNDGWGNPGVAVPRGPCHLGFAGRYATMTSTFYLNGGPGGTISDAVMSTIVGQGWHISLGNGWTTNNNTTANVAVAVAFAWERALTGSEFAAHYADPFCFLTEA